MESEKENFERIGETQELQGKFHPDSRWNARRVRPHLTAAGYLWALKLKSWPFPALCFSSKLVEIGRPGQSISRAFKKRGKGWPTAFCWALFVPAGDPHGALLSLLLTLPSFLSGPAKLFVSFSFPFVSPPFAQLFPSRRSHCILLWSRAPVSDRLDAIFRRIGVSLPLVPFPRTFNLTRLCSKIVSILDGFL